MTDFGETESEWE